MPGDLVINTVDIPWSSTNAPKCRRCPGAVLYPITHSKEMADFDIWHHMFLTTHFKNLTMYQFTKPPALTLDLGCGTGYWAMEAAKQWKDSKIIGFDMAKIQPRLDLEHIKSLGQRLEWVHGNFLGTLPFPPDSFDFVRMAGLGLAIPEDEWQFVLEEVRRVMRPGAVLEIIEEDLLFPCSSALLRIPGPSSIPSPCAVRTPTFELHKRRSTNFLEQSTTSERSPIASLFGSIHDYTSLSSRRSLLLPSLYTSPHSSSTNFTYSASTLALENTGDDHPQDHTRLKTSWDAMLATRFLSPNLLSVIPFYLTTSSFSDIKKYPPLVIPLPHNPGRPTSLKGCQSMGSIQIKGHERKAASAFSDFDFAPAMSTKSFKTDGCSFRSSIQSANKTQPPVCASMHLAKTVSTIRGCKEAMWVEYKKLYFKDALNILSRTAPDEEDYLSQPAEHVARTAFEVDWRNWEYDMQDRMALRSSLSTHVLWTQTMSETDRPPWHIWRAKLDPQPDTGTSTSGHSIAAYSPDDLCKSLCVFTGVAS